MTRANQGRGGDVTRGGFGDARDGVVGVRLVIRCRGVDAARLVGGVRGGGANPTEVPRERLAANASTARRGRGGGYAGANVGDGEGSEGSGVAAEGLGGVVGRGPVGEVRGGVGPRGRGGGRVVVVDRDGTGGGDARAEERRVALGERGGGVARGHLGELAARGELGVPTPSVVARALEVAEHIPRQRHLRVRRARLLLRATGIRVDRPQAVAMAIARHLRVHAVAQKRLRRTRGARARVHRRGNDARAGE